MMIATLFVASFAACEKSQNTDNEPDGDQTYTFGYPLTQMVQEDGEYSLEYEYNQDEQLIKSTVTYGSDIFTTTFTYQEDGSITANLPEGHINNSTPVEYTLTFNSNGYLEKQVVVKTANPDDIYETITFSYDKDGHITESTQSNSSYTKNSTFTWENSELISIKKTYVYSDYSDLEYQDETIYTYGDEQRKLTTFDCTLSINEDHPSLPTSWYGVPSASLSSAKVTIYSSNETTGSLSETSRTLQEYSYTLDEQGYITSMSVDEEEMDQICYTFSYFY